MVKKEKYSQIISGVLFSGDGDRRIEEFFHLFGMIDGQWYMMSNGVIEKDRFGDVGVTEAGFAQSDGHFDDAFIITSPSEEGRLRFQALRQRLAATRQLHLQLSRYSTQLVLLRNVVRTQVPEFTARDPDRNTDRNLCQADFFFRQEAIVNEGGSFFKRKNLRATTTVNWICCEMIIYLVTI